VVPELLGAIAIVVEDDHTVTRTAARCAAIRIEPARSQNRSREQAAVMRSPTDTALMAS